MNVTSLKCQCGAVRLEATGKHIISVECYCDSCRKAGAHFESLPGAPTVLEPNGATRFVLQRKDRTHCVLGAEHLREHWLTPKATTRRVVASCCNTPMFLEFVRGHWLSLYGRRYPADRLPPLEARTMTSDVEGLVLPDDVPNGKTQTASFMFKLLGAWIGMGFRVPPVTFVQGALEGSAARVA
jgi:hypothetical protein